MSAQTSTAAAAATPATTTSATAQRRRRASVILYLAAAIVVGTLLNALVAAIAIGAGADATFPPIGIIAFASLTTVSIIVGYIGWNQVIRRTRRPASALRLIVPVFLVLSFIPDLVFLAIGTQLGDVLGLMIMHIVVIAVAVPVYLRLAPAHNPVL